MKDKRGWILNLILILVIILVVSGIGYFLYLNLPGEPEYSNVVVKKPELEVSNLSSEVKQFYPNIKFNHNHISYIIDSNCSNEKRERMLEAFSELSKKVEIISFYEGGSDIKVSCSETEKEEVDKDYFIAGEGGAKEIVQTEKYNVIINGIILLHKNPRNAKECSWANIELHELLHVFGFDHSKDKNSLMYPYLENCEQKLDQSIINNLKELYSKENLADLYFVEVKAIKKGRYLDFNVSVKNSGVVNAENVILSVFDDNKKIDDFKLDDILFGAGVNFQVANLKLSSRTSENIELVIDSDNLIKELDENNNAVKLKFE